MTEFTPFLSLAGGALIGLASVALMAFHGRIAGINGILGGLLDGPKSEGLPTRIAFLVGMIAAPTAILAVTGEMPQITVPVSNLMLAIGGFIVGFGTTMGSGCTSGHGVCGIARLSPRSIIATLMFMASTLVTVYVIRHVIGG
ncbi:MAG: YeeE/YedE family protein [Rhodobacteraceae bacterium]|nr:YeeE/YedE family protein [Paracoccaceae bacterium]